MELNDSTNTDFSGFSLSDLSTDGDGKNNGEHFTTVETCLGESVVITFHSKAMFDRVMKGLSQLYSFDVNKSQSALVATVLIDGQSVKITSYSTSKIVVQGKLAAKWKTSIFQHLADTICAEPEPDTYNTSDSKHVSPVQAIPLRKSKSLLAKLKDLTASTDSKYLKELKRAEKSGDKDYQKKLEEGWKTGAEIKTIKKKGSTPVSGLLIHRRTDRDQTSVKQISMPQSQHPASPQNQHDPIAPIHLQNCSTPRKAECNLTSSNQCESTADSQAHVEIQSSTSSYTSEIDELRNDNKTYKHEIQQLKNDNQKLKVRNDEQAKQITKLLDRAEALTKTLHDTKTKASEQSKHITALSSKAKDLENKLKESTTLSLLQEEQLNKTRKCNEKLQEEKQRVTNRLHSQNADKDKAQQVESQVSTAVVDISNLRAEMSEIKQKLISVASLVDIQLLKTELKNDLKRELDNLNKQRESEGNHETAVCAGKPAIPSCSSIETNSVASGSCSDVVDLTNDEQNPFATKQKTQGNQRQKPKVIIIGDSTTQGLDSARMSGKTLDVHIDSNPGANVKNIRDRITLMNKKRHSVGQFDAIVIHAGINNISNAETPDQIVQEYEELVQTIETINDKSKIIISSILPKKEDKLSVPNVAALNKKLCAYCENKGLIFIDHTQNFKFNEKTTDRTLFRDEIHLTTKGVAVLAKQLKLVLHKAFNLSASGNHNGRENFRLANNWKTPQQHWRHQNQQQRWKIPPWAMHHRYW